MPADRLLHPKCGHSHKVSMLTDLEFRVWVQYLLSADDFGVMLDTPAKMQADNRHLLNRRQKEIRRCIDALVACGLLHRFEHQGQACLFSHNWQRWQKVEYPRATDMPCPPTEALELCEPSTRELFTKHPGGQRKDRRRADDAPNDSERASQIHPDSIPPTRAGAPAKRLTANGSRLAANGSEGGSGETELCQPDVWLQELQQAYPQQRVTSGYRTETAFIAELSASEHAPTAYATMRANLENHKRSHEWRVKGMVPALEKWLRNGLWKRQMDEAAPVAEQLAPRTNRTLEAASRILGGRQ